MVAVAVATMATMGGALAACAAGLAPAGDDPGTSSDGTSSGGGGAGGQGGDPTDFDAGLGGQGGTSVNPDAACAAVTKEATVQALPVDILWIVDNSNSMEPAIAEVKQGLNDFADLIAASSLDYRVVLLSRRGVAALSLCIPQPLAGDANCGNGARFFHSNVDILSTQPLEQVLGTLGQTAGYALGDAKGGEPWAGELRAEATKTFVIVTDDNARLSATDFETFPGGQNPFNSLILPPGLLDPSWNGLFDGYLFSGIYGWGSEIDPSVKCTFTDMTQPASSGPTYTTLVDKTGGVRAKLCDGASAWGPFMQAVAQAVLETSKIECELDIPTLPGEMIDFGAVNVALKSGDEQTLIPKVGGAADCGDSPGWYYDDETTPTQVILCPLSCTDAQGLAGPGKTGSVEVLFGCETILQ